MTSMTVRDVRPHRPNAEKALAEGEEILITRDSKPVARLLPLPDHLVPGLAWRGAGTWWLDLRWSMARSAAGLRGLG
jgi:Phd_YefM.